MLSCFLTVRSLDPSLFVNTLGWLFDLYESKTIFGGFRITGCGGNSFVLFVYSSRFTSVTFPFVIFSELFASDPVSSDICDFLITLSFRARAKVGDALPSPFKVPILVTIWNAVLFGITYDGGLIGFLESLVLYNGAILNVPLTIWISRLCDANLEPYLLPARTLIVYFFFFSKLKLDILLVTVGWRVSPVLLYILLSAMVTSEMA